MPQPSEALQERLSELGQQMARLSLAIVVIRAPWKLAGMDPPTDDELAARCHRAARLVSQAVDVLHGRA